jgi:hypothetical protein
MDLKGRKAEYESQAQALYRERPALLRATVGKPEKRKLVDEYMALAEELLAVSYDGDRAEHMIPLCDGEDERGKAQREEYTRMLEYSRARVEALIPKVEALKESLGV